MPITTRTMTILMLITIPFIITRTTTHNETYLSQSGQIGKKTTGEYNTHNNYENNKAHARENTNTT